MSKYSYTPFPSDFYKNVSADIVGKELSKIEKKYGYIKPQDVVNEAKDNKHPLHSCFEWDESIAAEKFRVQQAKGMIRCVVKIVKEDKPAVRAFVNIVKNRDYSYKNIEKVMTVVEDREQLVNRALNELNTWKNRYRDLRELSNYFKALDKVKSNGKKKISTV